MENTPSYQKHFPGKQKTSCPIKDNFNPFLRVVLEISVSSLDSKLTFRRPKFKVWLLWDAICH